MPYTTLTLLSHASALVTQPRRSRDSSSASPPGSALWGEARNAMQCLQPEVFYLGSELDSSPETLGILRAALSENARAASTFCRSCCIPSLESILQRCIPVNQSHILIKIRSPGITQVGKVVGYTVITMIPFFIPYLQHKYLFPS